MPLAKLSIELRNRRASIAMCHVVERLSNRGDIFGERLSVSQMTTVVAVTLRLADVKRRKLPHVARKGSSTDAPETEYD